MKSNHEIAVRGHAAGMIYALIPLVMADIGGVAKNRRNEQQKYSFRGIEDFYLAAHPALITHGVFCAPTVLEREEYRFEKTNEYGKTTTWLHVSLKVEHRFYAPDGSFVPVTTWGEGLDNSDKASNKAMSGAMKYALIELFCVPTQDVDDSDRTSPETGTRRNKAPVAVTTEDIEIKRESAPPNKRQDSAVSTLQRESEGADTHSTAGIGPAEGGIATSKPEDLPAVEYISVPQQRNFHKECRAAVPEHRKMEADNLIYKWLGDHGYRDKDTLPTASMIPAAGWLKVRERAIEWLKQQ